MTYPAAFEIYRSHCETHLTNPQYKTVSTSTSTLNEVEEILELKSNDDSDDDNSDTSSNTRAIRAPEGTALIIPPQRGDYENNSDNNGGKKHWIICLFTSGGFGRRRSSPGVILHNTLLAVRDMKEQLALLGEGNESKGGDNHSHNHDEAGNKDYNCKDEDEGLGMPSGLWSCRFNSGLFAVPWELSRKVLVEEGLTVTVVN
ncbi:hypothetical protein MAP00_002878 [Monascus purpureus]|nr:hypothetical protein MAP00_002878 [Monascus purpureus]